MPEVVGANLRNRTHRISVRIEVPDAGAPRATRQPEDVEGVLLAQGSGLGGWSLFLVAGRPAYAHNFVSLREDRVVADRPLEPGPHEVALHFERTGDHRGVAHLMLDGSEAGRLEVDPFTVTRFSLTGAGTTCGYGNGLPVSDAYGDGAGSPSPAASSRPPSTSTDPSGSTPRSRPRTPSPPSSRSGR